MVLGGIRGLESHHSIKGSFCGIRRLEAVVSVKTKGELRLSFCVIIKAARNTS